MSAKSSRERVRCHVCGRLVYVRADGTLAQHDRAGRMGSKSRQCEGSREKA